MFRKALALLWVFTRAFVNYLSPVLILAFCICLSTSASIVLAIFAAAYLFIATVAFFFCLFEADDFNLLQSMLLVTLGTDFCLWVIKGLDNVATKEIEETQVYFSEKRELKEKKLAKQGALSQVS